MHSVQRTPKLPHQILLYYSSNWLNYHKTAFAVIFMKRTRGEQFLWTTGGFHAAKHDYRRLTSSPKTGRTHSPGFEKKRMQMRCKIVFALPPLKDIDLGARKIEMFAKRYVAKFTASACTCLPVQRLRGRTPAPMDKERAYRHTQHAVADCAQFSAALPQHPRRPQHWEEL